MKKNEMTAADFRKDHVDQQEHGLQKRCVKWFRVAYRSLMIVAIPNAAKRSFKLAAMLKAEGMVSGFPDTFVAYPSNGYHGLFAELKTVHGKPSPEQLIVHAYLRSAGYMVIMPRTFEEFESQINEYLKQS